MMLSAISAGTSTREFTYVPSATVVAVGALPSGAQIEIELVAAKK